MNRALAKLQDRPRAVALGVVLLLALTYTGLNLHSAWDPVTRLQSIRAGIVLEDEPVTAGTTKVFVGEDLAATLEQNGPFAWKRLSRSEAEERIKGGSLDFYVHIPSDVSRLVAGLPGASSPEKARLTVYSDPAFNYPMHEIADSVAATVREQLNGKIAATYLDQLLAGLHGALNGVKQAAGGARQIADGTKAAGEGATRLAGGLDQAKAGADQVHDGTGQVVAGAGAVADGAVQIRDGNRQLAAGLDKAAAGAREVSDGNGQLHGGAQEIIEGYRRLAEGGDELTAGIGQVKDGVGQIKRGVQDSLGTPDPVLSESSAAIQKAMQNLLIHKPYLIMDRDFKQLMFHLNRLNERADELQRESVAQLTTALTQVEGGLTQVSDGSRRLANGARTGYREGQALVSGAARLRDGAAELAGGVEQAAAGARQLADGADRLAAGATQLRAGSAQLYAGTGSLADGLTQLRDGGKELSGGLTQLTTGTEQLASGLGGATAAEGVPPRENAAAMSQPVAVENGKVTPIPKPGEALLAVVIPSALWLGALALLLAGLVTGADWNAGDTARERLRRVAVPGGALTLGVWLTCLAFGPRVAHPVWLLLFIGLATFSFLALNQMLLRTLGHWGLVLSGLLMILMPVATGSRAPFILLPKLYQWAAPVLPITHGIRGVQAAVSGGNWSVFWISVAALGVLLLLSLWLSRFQRKAAQ